MTDELWLDAKDRYESFIWSDPELLADSKRGIEPAVAAAWDLWYEAAYPNGGYI